MQFGQLNFGKWSDGLQLTRGGLYSWLLNNFWYTNFAGYQLGDLTFRFAVTTGAGELDVAAAAEFGRQVRVGPDGCLAAVDTQSGDGVACRHGRHAPVVSERVPQ